MNVGITLFLTHYFWFNLNLYLFKFVLIHLSFDFPIKKINFMHLKKTKKQMKYIKPSGMKRNS